MVAINQTQIIFLHINFDFSKNQSEIVFFSPVSTIQHNRSIKHNQPPPKKNPQACDLRIISKNSVYMQILRICYNDAIST